MSVAHTVWSLDEKKPLIAAELKDEKELEELIKDNIEILNNSWMVIGNQVKTKAGKYIDILCLDYDGDLVVIELKKDMTPRDVTAQVIDYAASVSEMSVAEIAQVFLAYSGGKDLNDAYKEKYGVDLDEDTFNQNVKMIIVAAEMDAGTERIIRYLRETYQVDINILFFHVYQCEEQRIISRAWFKEDIEDSDPSKNKQQGKWNGEYYVSFGTYEDGRSWEDARKCGFISAGRGEWHSKTLAMLLEGNRVWVNIPHTGFVGVGTVIGEKQKASDTTFTYKGKETPMSKLPLKGEYFEDCDDDEYAEYVVKVQWINTVDEEEAIHELGFFGNQNTVCKPRTEKWNYTIERLRKYWNITE